MRNRTRLVLICGAVICCFAGRAFAREEHRRDFQKPVPLPSGRGFRLENSNGNIKIVTQAKPEAYIRAAIQCSASTAAEAKSVCDRIQIAVDEGTGGVSVRTDYSRQGSWRNIGFQVDYDITLPDTAPLTVRNKFGYVSVTDLRAAAQITNNNGRVTLTGGRGRQQIENSFGDVEVRTNAGDVIVKSGNGAVTASDITGAVDITGRFGNVRVTNASRGATINSNNGNIDAVNVGGPILVVNTFGYVALADAKGDVSVQNQNGAVRVTGVAGSAELRTTFDRVNFSRIGKTLTVRASNANIVGDTVGENAIVETTFGSVDLRGVKGSARVTAGNSPIRLRGVGGEVYAKTTFNGVTVTDAAGPVTVENQNGSVVVEAKAGQPCKPIILGTTFGPIRVTVPGGTGYNLTAKTSFGRIRSEYELAVSGDLSPTAVTAKIAGGGCELRLTGQNGNIDILKGVK
jgi:hypothetical protein